MSERLRNLFSLSYSISSWALVPVSVVIAIWLGLHVSQTGALTLAVTAAGGLVVLSTLGRRVESLFLVSLGVLLFGYMVQGKGFAYFGIPPLYVGEIVLGLGLAAVLFARIALRLDAVQGLLLGFMLLGITRTVPFVTGFGLYAIRDAALWYYGIFAILVANMLTRDRLLRLLPLVASLLPIGILWFTFMSSFLRLIEGSLPHFPGSPLPLLSTMKAGDRAVVLVGLAAFVSTGLYERFGPSRRFPTPVFWLLWLICAGLVAVENRGGLLALGVASMALFLFRPSIEWFKFAYICAILAMLFVIVDPDIGIGGSRSISVDQLATNVQSIYSDTTSDAGYVQDNKNWRLNWWRDIYGDTVGGPLTWQGWGFGPNLAFEYGIHGEESGDLRSPHNSHLTVLARLGLPGMLVWIAIQVLFVAQLLRTIRRAHYSQDSIIGGVCLWVLAVWIACIVNATFDVYLEGPQGAIPFWCVFGAGLAAIRLQHEVQGRDKRDTQITSGGLRANPSRP